MRRVGFGGVLGGGCCTAFARRRSLRADELLDVVDELLSHHDDEQLLGQLDEAATRAALLSQPASPTVSLSRRKGERRWAALTSSLRTPNSVTYFPGWPMNLRASHRTRVRVPRRGDFTGNKWPEGNPDDRLARALLAAPQNHKRPTPPAKGRQAHSKKEGPAAQTTIERRFFFCLPAFEEGDVHRRRVEVDKLEHEHFEDEHVFVFGLSTMHF